MRVVHFDLTREFNRGRTRALLAHAPAVMHHRVAIVGKDAEWVLEESPQACEAVLSVLEAHGARYRPGAPLDVSWLSGGWTSHFEFTDAKQRRVRCDFVTRPPRVPPERLRNRFGRTEGPTPAVLDFEDLILSMRTRDAINYPVIGEIARHLPEPVELAYTTDVERIVELAPRYGAGSTRPPVVAARAGAREEEVAEALALEVYELRSRHKERLAACAESARAYLHDLLRSTILDRPLREAHAALIDLAAHRLPRAASSAGVET